MKYWKLQLNQTLSLVVLIAAMVLAGCSTKTPSEFVSPTQAAIETVNEQATINGCMQFAKEKQQQELAQYDNLTGQDKAMTLMHRETMQMIQGVWGKGDECKPGTNMWDAYITYVAQTEETKRKISGDVKTVATVGVVTGGAVKLTDAVMGRVGDKINTTGDNAGVQKTTTQTTTNTNTTSTNVGEGQSTANGGVAAPGAKDEKGETTASEVDPAHWNECITTTGGARPSNAEINGCMIGYGYQTEVKGDQIYLDGKPYNGPGGE